MSGALSLARLWSWNLSEILTPFALALCGHLYRRLLLPVSAQTALWFVHVRAFLFARMPDEERFFRCCLLRC